jgi:iron complex transport system ATP-binding protein
MIEIRNISFSYGKKQILHDISFGVERGHCVGILGNNGAGKSTLVTCLNRIRTPKTGSVKIANEDVLKMNRLAIAQRISYVAQKNELSQITVFDTILLGRKPYIQWSVTPEDIEIVEDTIERMGLSEFKLRLVNQLSGGELQKVMLARALVQQPQLLLLDEPTSNLDPKNQHEMMELVYNLTKQEQISSIIVMHDLTLALRYCDRFLFIKEGEVYKYGDESIVTAETLSEVYDIEAAVEVVNGRKIAVIG